MNRCSRFHLRARLCVRLPNRAVLDIHSDWVGPCVVMQPMYESLTLALESWESRLRILTVSLAPLAAPTGPGYVPVCTIAKFAVRLDCLNLPHPPPATRHEAARR